MTRPTVHPLSDATRARLEAGGLDAGAVCALVERTIEEDLGGGIDVTTAATVPPDQRSVAEFVPRSAGTVAGIDVAVAAMEIVCGPSLRSEIRVADGARVVPGTVLARVEGPTAGILLAERTALNILCHLSGVATATSRWVDALAGTGARVRDTRKTTPGLRMLEKYAVRCAGGVNHRMGLHDAALVKDNHIVAAGGVAEAFALVRALDSGIPVEIEVDDLGQLAVALEAGADVVLLDNMSTTDMRAAVTIAAGHTERTGRGVILEASGGLTLDNAADVASTGVHFISVGAITHSAPILDIGLDLTTVL